MYSILLLTLVTAFVFESAHCDQKVLNTFNDIENKSSSFLVHESPFGGSDKTLKREKRHLLWPNGISKIVLGFLAPVETRDKVNWRTLNLAYNFQSQYIPVPDLKKVWNVFARQLRVRRMLYEKTGEYEKDMTRHLIYGAAEIYLNNQGKPGRECLLKSICDAAEHPIHQGGIFEQVIHLILTPNMNEDINVDYRNARRAGEYGSDCRKLYACPMGAGLLDKFSYLV